MLLHFSYCVNQRSPNLFLEICCIFLQVILHIQPKSNTSFCSSRTSEWLDGQIGMIMVGTEVPQEQDWWLLLYTFPIICSVLLSSLIMSPFFNPYCSRYQLYQTVKFCMDAARNNAEHWLIITESKKTPRRLYFLLHPDKKKQTLVRIWYSCKVGTRVIGKSNCE